MSGLVKGVKKAFKSVTNVVKKVVKSKVFKVVAVAALAYFGGAAITSMIGGGTASAGIGSAWGGLQGAGSALSGAFSALSTGFTGGAAAGATGTFAAGQAATQAAITGQTAAIGATSGAYTGKAMETFVANGGGAVQAATPVAAQAATAATSSPGLLAAAGDATKAAMVTSGVNLAGQMIQGYAQQKQAEEQAANRDYFGVNGKGEKSTLAAPGLLNPSNIMPNNPVPQLQPLKSLDDLIARQQQTVSTYKKWGV